MATLMARMTISPMPEIYRAMLDSSFRFMLSAVSYSSREMLPTLYSSAFRRRAAVLRASPGKLILVNRVCWMSEGRVSVSYAAFQKVYES